MTTKHQTSFRYIFTALLISVIPMTAVSEISQVSTGEYSTGGGSADPTGDQAKLTIGSRGKGTQPGISTNFIDQDNDGTVETVELMSVDFLTGNVLGSETRSITRVSAGGRDYIAFPVTAQQGEPIPTDSIVPFSTSGELFIPVENDQVTYTQPDGFQLLITQVAGVTAGSNFEINYGVAGTWFNALTDGQGFFFDLIPGTSTFVVSWFTFDELTSAAKNSIPGDEQRWFTAQGTFAGNQANLTVFQTRNGVFNDPATVNTTAVGTLVIDFDGCTSGTLTYNLTEFNLSGEIPITKLVPDTICQQIADGQLDITTPPGNPNTNPFAINYGLIGTWFNPATSGQGFFADIIPSNNTFVVSWFTYDDAAPGRAIDAPEQRWFTAQGSFSGNQADLQVFQTRNGAFDNAAPVQTAQTGTMTVDFDSCVSATVNFDLPDFGLNGSIPIVKLVPDVICESISTGTLSIDN